MAAIKLLCHSADVNPSVLSKEENLLLEADLFSYLCRELMEMTKHQYKAYFSILKFDTNMENKIMENNFVRGVICDILSTEEYSLPGLAYYTNVPEDVIFEIVSGKNVDPSASLLRKIIELHRSVRPNLYREIMQKIMQESTAVK